MAEERDLASLREEIQWSGTITRWVRGSLIVLVSFCAACLLLLLFTAKIAAPRDSRSAEQALNTILTGVVGATVGGLVISLVIAWPAAAAFRSLRSTALRRRLVTLPPAQLARVLIPLRSDCLEDTRRIVEPMLREFGLGPSEVVPAPDAPGRDVDPVPAGPAEQPPDRLGAMP